MVFALTFERARCSFLKALEGKPDLRETKILHKNFSHVASMNFPPFLEGCFE